LGCPSSLVQLVRTIQERAADFDERIERVVQEMNIDPMGKGVYWFKRLERISKHKGGVRYRKIPPEDQEEEENEEVEQKDNTDQEEETQVRQEKRRGKARNEDSSKKMDQKNQKGKSRATNFSSNEESPGQAREEQPAWPPRRRRRGRNHGDYFACLLKVSWQV
jgi:hypothetical protein